MSAFVDELNQWTDVDAAAVALGRNLGVFPSGTSLADVKGVLWTNGAVGNTLYGMLDRLARLGLLECDGVGRRYRAAPPRLHPLEAHEDVPSLAAGPGADALVRMSVDATNGFSLRADRAGFRHLARVFDEIADSGVEDGWCFRRDQAFGPADDGPAFSFTLVSADADDPLPND